MDSFPSLTPRLVDSLWFKVDEPCDNDKELQELETKYQTWLTSVGGKDYDLVPIGKNSIEDMDTEGEEEDEEEEQDDESPDEEEDGEMESDMNFRESPVIFNSAPGQ